MSSERERRTLALLRDAIESFIILAENNGEDKIPETIRDMPVSRILILLQVLIENIDDLPSLKAQQKQRYGLSASATARLLSWWTEKKPDPFTKVSRGLLELESDPDDYRRKVISTNNATDNFTANLSFRIQTLASALSNLDLIEPEITAEPEKLIVDQDEPKTETEQESSNIRSNDGSEITDTIHASSKAYVGNDQLQAEISNYFVWLKTVRASSKHTIDAYARDLRAFLNWLKLHTSSTPSFRTIEQLKTEDIDDYVSFQKGRSSASIERGLSVARSFTRWGASKGFLSAHSSSAFKRLRPAFVKTSLDSSSLPSIETIEPHSERMLEGLKSFQSEKDWKFKRDLAAVTLVFGCGLRVSQALSLKVDEFTEGAAKGELSLQSGSRTIHKAIGKSAIAVIIDYINSCPHRAVTIEHQTLLRGDRGGAYGVRQWTQLMRKLDGFLAPELDNESSLVSEIQRVVSSNEQSRESWLRGFFKWLPGQSHETERENQNINNTETQQQEREQSQSSELNHHPSSGENKAQFPSQRSSPDDQAHKRVSPNLILYVNFLNAFRQLDGKILTAAEYLKQPILDRIPTRLDEGKYEFAFTSHLKRILVPEDMEDELWQLLRNRCLIQLQCLGYSAQQLWKLPMKDWATFISREGLPKSVCSAVDQYLSLRPESEVSQDLLFVGQDGNKVSTAYFESVIKTMHPEFYTKGYLNKMVLAGELKKLDHQAINEIFGFRIMVEENWLFPSNMQNFSAEKSGWLSHEDPSAVIMSSVKDYL